MDEMDEKSLKEKEKFSKWIKARGNFDQSSLFKKASSQIMRKKAAKKDSETEERKPEYYGRTR